MVSGSGEAAMDEEPARGGPAQGGPAQRAPVEVRESAAVQVGDHNRMHLHLGGRMPPWWTRSGYIEQVRDIAPDGGRPGGLVGRRAELAEIAAFCLGDSEYLWWKAGPWAGKSGLLSTFVLNPPPQVEVVSFFITARLAAQSDSTAFTDMLIDQLSAIVGESVPSSLTPAARDAHRRGLLRAAVEKLRGEGRRLVLVVDGLDEDRSGRAGSGLPSVASLLPKICGDGLRVVVSSRPDPDLPGDVPADHPLRRCTARRLTVSRYATEVAVRAERELRQLLHGDHLHQEVVGLITASGGGLTLAELEELTGAAPFRLRDLLGGVFGRTVAGRDTGAADSPGRVYLFTHETLRETAIDELGTQLGVFRDRLHEWAERYRGTWPPDIPQYLLRGYARMLTDCGDTDRLAVLATDRARHERMLVATGGDAAALTEIRNSQNLLLSRPAMSESGLYRLLLLSYHREHLETRIRNIPTALPAAWAAAGQPTRAEALARSIMDPYQQARALAGVSGALAAAGDTRRAEQIAWNISVWLVHDEALHNLIGVLAGTPAQERAYDISANIHSYYWQALATATLVAYAGDSEQASRWADDAELYIARISSLPVRARAQAALARALAHGDPPRALALWDAAERISRGIAEPERQVEALIGLLPAAAAIKGPSRVRELLDDAEQLTRRAMDWNRRTQALIDIAIAAARTGDIDRAESMARSILDPYWQENALVELAPAVATAGDVARAESIARGIPNRERRTRALARLAPAIAAAGETGRAEDIAREITDPERRAQTLAELAPPVARVAGAERAGALAAEAEQTARGIVDQAREAQILEALSSAAARASDPSPASATGPGPPRPAPAEAAPASDPERGAALVDEAAEVADAIADPNDRDRALTDLSWAAAEAGELVAAKEIVSEISDRARRQEALVGLIRRQSGFGDLRELERIARQITSRHWRTEALSLLVTATAGAGDVARAEQLAQEIDDSARRARALADLVTVVAAAGDVADGERIARTVTDPDQQVRALLEVARASGPPSGDRLLGEVLSTAAWQLALPLLAERHPRAILRATADIRVVTSGDPRHE
ncbi:hypothetical protein AB0M02_39785 [Actinoplanes sp. NPDC051861]|uniref:hypothetical protein n=1 Tax=Actinoplanes sp. NPDC051861 TaxID=3155170 RepID=UPI0034412EFC